jgi:CCR4-NOT transcription complex subunit 7/8
MRIGSSQAGSDSLLTSATFFKMREIYFADNLDDEQFNGTLYGLGSSYANGNGTEPDRAGATAAERDRGPMPTTPHQQHQHPHHQQNHQQGMNGPPGLTNGLSTPGLGGGFPTPLAAPFAPAMGGNPFARNAMGTVGGDR